MKPIFELGTYLNSIHLSKFLGELFPVNIFWLQSNGNTLFITTCGTIFITISIGSIRRDLTSFVLRAFIFGLLQFFTYLDISRNVEIYQKICLTY